VTGSACSDQPSISLGLLRLDCRWFGNFVVFGLLGLSEIAGSLTEIHPLAEPANLGARRCWRITDKREVIPNEEVRQLFT
jgi:hypothetical protein